MSSTVISIYKMKNVRKKIKKKIEKNLRCSLGCNNLGESNPVFYNPRLGDLLSNGAP